MSRGIAQHYLRIIAALKELSENPSLRAVTEADLKAYQRHTLNYKNSYINQPKMRRGIARSGFFAWDIAELLKLCDSSTMAAHVAQAMYLILQDIPLDGITDEMLVDTDGKISKWRLAMRPLDPGQLPFVEMPHGKT